jgi:ribosomal protein S15P/S13E
MVGKRRRHLNYLYKVNPKRYQEVAWPHKVAREVES